VDSGSALPLATHSKHRERALTEAEAYARCHGNRALCPVRITVSPGQGRGWRAGYLLALGRPADALTR
jgi:hypothetical protein